MDTLPKEQIEKDTPVQERQHRETYEERSDGHIGTQKRKEKNVLETNFLWSIDEIREEKAFTVFLFTCVKMDAHSLGIIVTNSKARIQSVSPSFVTITGYPIDELIGTDCKLLQGSNTSQLAKEKIKDCMEKNEICDVVLVNYKKNGQMFWNRLQIVPLFACSGELTAYVGFIREMHELASFVDKLLPVFQWVPPSHPLSAQSAKQFSQRTKTLALDRVEAEEDESPSSLDSSGDIALSDLPSSYLYSQSRLNFVAETLLPTIHGEFKVRAYRNNIDGSEPIAIIFGDVQGKSDVICRVHDQCFTSEVLHSLKCDCQAQLEYALRYIRENASGMVIYLPQEGRGMGLANKIKAYSVQEHGLDTVDSNAILGFSQDSRSYDSVRSILHELNVFSIRLLSNNPRKFDHLSSLGIQISSRIPCVVETSSLANRYLLAKQTRMQHMT